MKRRQLQHKELVEFQKAVKKGRKESSELIELGNLLWGHSRGSYHIDRDLYQERFVNFLEKLGCDAYGCSNSSNEDGELITDKFIVRPYYWGDDESRFNLPNFECKELGLEIRWYKYPFRDSYSNIEMTNELMTKIENLL